LYETKEEKKIRKELERFKKNPSKTCFNHLQYIIQNIKNENLLKFLAIEITKDDLFNELEPLIADNIYTPAHILKELALSQNEITKAYIAFNPKTPLAVINLLAKDENKFISIIANKHKRIPKKSFLSYLLNYIKCLLGF